jgi:signal transduction histidine kinase/DNA-binding response OmpR family regulator
MTARQLLTVDLRSDADVVVARQRARQLAALFGLEAHDQTRFATAVSEMARNAVRYGGGGKCDFAAEGEPPASLLVRIDDEGPGIRDLDDVLAGRSAANGQAMGFSAARRLVEHFDIDSKPGRGTRVTLRKDLPWRDVPVALPRVAEEIARHPPAGAQSEMAEQNRELMRLVDELQKRDAELLQLKQELEDTNRGVVALYAELDEKADSLVRVNEAKTRFLSNMSHEFRTPLNSIQSLTRILLDGLEGPLTPDQTKAITLVRGAALGLAELVNDLLDIAKVDAGKVQVRPADFDVGQLFGALRGLLRPLLASASVDLVFDDLDGIPLVYGDEAKVSQVLRNFISNALKFTEHGEVRVSARLLPDDRVSFSVTDTGIGIAPEHQQRIFEEFGQVDGPIQRKVKGTGLGLPLSKKLAELMGGSVSVRSEPDVGSRFSLVLPLRYGHAAPRAEEGVPVLVVEDDERVLAQHQQFFSGTRYRLVAARSLEEARTELLKAKPACVVVPITVAGQSTRPLLAELRSDAALREVPVLGVADVEGQDRQLAIGADVVARRPRERHELLELLGQLLAPRRRVLLLARDGEMRDALRGQLSDARLQLIDARDATEALRRVRDDRPAAIVLDAAPGWAVDAIARLRDEPAARGVPLVVHAGRELPGDEFGELSRSAFVVRTAAVPRDEAGALLRGAVWDRLTGSARG